jgi:uncharacterized membrane protein HdeD (DUF308 family)
MDEEFAVTGPAHRRAVRERVMKVVGVLCLIGGCIAILEVEAMMAIALAVLGLAWIVAAKLAA